MDMRTRTRRSALALAALSLLCAGANAQQQQQPPSSTKPIRLVVPFGPGGVADLTARTVAQKMSEAMGQSIVVDNKPGAGGVVASDAVAKTAPDGLTMLLMSNGNAVSAGLFKRLPFDTVRDFAPVSTLGYFDMAVVTAADARFKTMQELLAYAKAHPGTVNIGTINVGSTQHLAAELFKRSTGIDAQVIPFNGSPALITALRGGQVDAGVEILAPILGQISGKSLRASRSWARSARSRCPTRRRSRRAARPVSRSRRGTRLPCPRRRRPRSSRGSARKPMRRSPRRKSRNGCASLASRRRAARRSSRRTS